MFHGPHAHEGWHEAFVESAEPLSPHSGEGTVQRVPVDFGRIVLSRREGGEEGGGGGEEKAPLLGSGGSLSFLCPHHPGADDVDGTGREARAQAGAEGRDQVVGCAVAQQAAAQDKELGGVVDWQLHASHHGRPLRRGDDAAPQTAESLAPKYVDKTGEHSCSGAPRLPRGVPSAPPKSLACTNGPSERLWGWPTALAKAPEETAPHHVLGRRVWHGHHLLGSVVESELDSPVAGPVLAVRAEGPL